MPDDWDSSTYSLSNANNDEADFSSNTLTGSQWSTLEQTGAVFLPAAGSRDGASVYSVGSYGHYWSASCSNGDDARNVNFGDGYLSPDNWYGRYYGRSVRLVCSAE